MRAMKLILCSLLQFVLLILYHGCEILMFFAGAFYGLLRFIGIGTIILAVIEYKDFIAYIQEAPDHIWFVIVMSIIFICIMFLPATILMFISELCENGIDKLDEIKRFS